MATLADLLGYGKDVAQGASNAVAGTVSAPVDVTAWLLRKMGAGPIIGDTPVGGSAWMANHGLTPQPQSPMAGMVGETLGNIVPMLAAARAPQIAAGLNKVAANVAAPATMNPQMGAVVYHGSPHTFDKFDMSKIGTGEGAQAYGHGLYLADSPEVAGTYGANLYKADIPDAHIAKMADLDAPMSQQPQALQDIYQRLGNYMPNKPLMDHMAIDQWMAPKLKAAGVPGIRYLDQGSRGVGAGTSNYVVFDDQIPQILQRSGGTTP